MHRRRRAVVAERGVAIEYRIASAADADGMGAARARAGWSVGASAATMARYLAGEHAPQQALAERAGFVAVEAGVIVGYTAGHLTRRFACAGELQWIVVIPECRGAGVADTLLRALAAWFVSQDARRICVNVEPENAPARAFYARHGASVLSEYWMEWSDISSVIGPTAD